MKNISIFISLAFLILVYPGCKHDVVQEKTVYQINTPNVSIKIDTIELNIEGRPLFAIKHIDKYYITCEKSDFTNQYSTDDWYAYLLISDLKGHIIKQTISYNYYEYSRLYVKNDSIILSSRFLDKMMYFNPNVFWDWDIIEPVKIQTYEDVDYQVFTTHHGEFGGTVFFKDKITGLQHGGRTTLPFAINKLNDKYYLTGNSYNMGLSSGSIFEIPDPRKMPIPTSEEFWKIKRLYHEMDTLLNLYDIFLSFSFIHKNQLLHIYQYQDSTHLAVVKDKKLCNLLTFKTAIFPIYPQQCSELYASAMFRTSNPYTFGIIEATPEDLWIHYINIANP